MLKLDQGVSGLGTRCSTSTPARAICEPRSSSRTRRSTWSSTSRCSTSRADRRGADRGRAVQEPERPAAHEPLGAGRHHVDHDQVLGGPHGQTYFGCHFPADPGVRGAHRGRGAEGRAAARARGVIGRAAVDFAAVGGRRRLASSALEINLRCGGTTHPLFALTSLTDGVYDPFAGEWRTRYGDIKHYVATDHLDSAAYARSRPTICSTSSRAGLGWDAEREVGVVLHMVSAIAVADRRADRDRRHARRSPAALLRRESSRRHRRRARLDPALAQEYEPSPRRRCDRRRPCCSSGSCRRACLTASTPRCVCRARRRGRRGSRAWPSGGSPVLSAPSTCSSIARPCRCGLRHPGESTATSATTRSPSSSSGYPRSSSTRATSRSAPRTRVAWIGGRSVLPPRATRRGSGHARLEPMGGSRALSRSVSSSLEPLLSGAGPVGGDGGRSYSRPKPHLKDGSVYAGYEGTRGRGVPQSRWQLPRRPSPMFPSSSSRAPRPFPAVAVGKHRGMSPRP